MIHTKIGFRAIILMLFCVVKINAQDVLTIEDAVKIALENNYEIKIASNNLNIEKTNVSSGNAGMLPVVTASIVDNNRLQNTSQTLASGTTNSLKTLKIIV